MAGASDPLEDMLFSEVDEKAVSDLVGSLESQLAGQGEPEGKAEANGGAGSVPPAKHLGKTLAAPVGTTTLEQQQQGRRNKPEMRQESSPKAADPDNTPPTPSCTASPGEPPTASATGVNPASSGGDSMPHRASITSATTTAASTSSTSTSSSTASSPASSRGAKVSLAEPSAEENQLRKRVGTPRRSASARLRSLNGASVTTRRSSGNMAGSVNDSCPPDASAQNSSRAVTSTAINTSTFTLTNASLHAGQSAIALDRGTPTIALHRLPSHIVASIAQNGTGTSVSALAQQHQQEGSSRPGSVTSPSSSPSSSQGNQDKANTNTGSSKIVDCQSKTVISSQLSGINSVISTVAPASCVVAPPATTTIATTTAAAVTTTTAVTQQPSTTTTTAAALATALPAIAGQTVTLGAVRPTVAAPTPSVPTTVQPHPRPALAAPQRIVAPQLIVRPPQQQTTIQLPPGFTIPQGKVAGGG